MSHLYSPQHPSQTHDVSYLTKENRKLRMQLQQTIKLKQLHQQVLIQINQQYPESSIIKTLVQIINHTNIENRKNKQNQYIIELQAKMMVLQKISQQTQQNQKQTYNLLAEQFQKLKQQNTKISQQLHKFYQKIGEVDYISGLVTKYKQLLTPTEQTMAFKKQQQQLLDALNIQQQTIKKISQEKDKLLRINVVILFIVIGDQYMKQEVERKKDQVRNMTMMFMTGLDDNGGEENQQQIGNVLDQLEDTQGQAIANEDPSTTLNLHTPISQRSSISTRKMNMSRISNANNTTLLLQQNNPNTTLNFIKMQRQLLKDVKQENQSASSITNQSQLADCPQLSILFPDKVQKIIKTKQKAKVPYLNMKKVREMMAKREQKMRKQWQQQKHHINPTNKIIQLQTQLDITRKQLANQSLKFRLIEDQLKRLRLAIDQLEKRNQLLVESNYRLKTNYQVVYKDYQLCKSITMQVERALGMAVGRDNQHKVREKLAILLGNKLQQQQLKKNFNLSQKQSKQHQQQQQGNSLQSTFRDQLRAKRFIDIFSNQKVKLSSDQRAYSK